MAPTEEWEGVCDGLNDHALCHCNGSPNVDSAYSNVDCVIITQGIMERVFAVFLMIYISIATMVCSYWIITFWKHRHRAPYRDILKARRPSYWVLSYSLILAVALEEGIATMFLFWSEVKPSRTERWDGVNYWTQYDGKPVYFGHDIDVILHFLYWFGFWSFFQSKIFKFSHLKIFTKICTKFYWQILLANFFKTVFRIFSWKF